MTTQVVLNDLYYKHADKIDGSIAQKVLSFISKLQSDPASPGLDLKTPQGIADKRIKTARVDDFWRAVLIELKPNAAYTLIAVMPHDDAYVYAGSLGYNVNEASNALEIIDKAALAGVLKHLSPTARAREASGPSLFVSLGLKTKDLHKFGISDSVAQAVLGLPDVDALLEFVEVLPKNLHNILLDLGEGLSVETVWAEHIPVLEKPVDPGDLETAAKSEASRVMFTDGSPEELRAVLEGSLRLWRVWLHPSQRALAYHDGWNGPARVTGGAGTGKTVTALHRARHLADRLKLAPKNEKVLVTTYTRNLANEMTAQLIELGGPEIKDRVEVVNIDRLVHKTITSVDTAAGHSLKLVGEDKSVDQDLQLAIDAAGFDWEPSFVRAEWAGVVLAQGITSKDVYLKAPRAGRSRRLNKPQRAEVWDIIERLTQYLSQRGVMTYTQAAARAANFLAEGAKGQTVYRHAVVDEAQDLHPAHWRLLRNLIPEGKDDLFIAGDAHQRIYGAEFRLSSCGIKIVGRSKRLTVNYRTSKQILGWCVGVTRGEAVDDLDDGTETLEGARSEFTGPAPVVEGYKSEAAELEGLIARLRSWHDGDVAWQDMAVMARNSWSVDSIVERLNAADVPASAVGTHSSEEGLADVVRVMTMHRGKGLEYRAVALVKVSDGLLPAPFVSSLAGEEQEAALQRERNLLYVAGSRARELLAVTWSGKPSALLP